MTLGGAPRLRFLRSIVADCRPIAASPQLEAPEAPGPTTASPRVTGVVSRPPAGMPVAPPPIGRGAPAEPVVPVSLAQPGAEPAPGHFARPSSDASDPPELPGPPTNLEDEGGPLNRIAGKPGNTERAPAYAEGGIQSDASVLARGVEAQRARNLPAARGAAQDVAGGAPAATRARRSGPAPAAGGAEPETGTRAEGAGDRPTIPREMSAIPPAGTAAETEVIFEPAHTPGPSPQRPDPSVPPEGRRSPPVEAVAARTALALGPAGLRRPGAGPRTKPAEPTVQIGHIDITVLSETPRSPEAPHRSPPQRSVASLHYLRRF